VAQSGHGNGVIEMSTLSMRDARMELKTTGDTKRLLSQAAALDGVDLTAFVLTSAVEKARQVLSQHNNIALSRQGQLKLVALLREPKRQPTEAMEKLMSLPDLPERQA
jgi:uncharacterized protein (DUF1778 family)